MVELLALGWHGAVVSQTFGSRKSPSPDTATSISGYSEKARYG